MKNNKMLKKLHDCEVEILNEIVRVCEKYSLVYFLVGGTLLGAVRHKGFIPWDDDLDIAMPREDYNKFLEIAPKELQPDFALQYHKNEKNYWLPFAKVRRKNTIYQEELPFFVNEQGIWVDVFPLDYVKNKNLCLNAYLKSKSIRLFINKLNDKEFNAKNWSFKFRLLFGLCKLFHIKNAQLMKIHDKIVPKKQKGDYIMNFGSQYGVEKQFMPKEYYFPAKKLEFEGKEYNVPNEYEKVLMQIYGADYMQLPPVEKRINHKPKRISFDTSLPDVVIEEE